MRNRNQDTLDLSTVSNTTTTGHFFNGLDIFTTRHQHQINRKSRKIRTRKKKKEKRPEPQVQITFQISQYHFQQSIPIP